MSQVFTNRYNGVELAPHPTRGFPVLFGMPAQGTISVEQYREVVQLWLSSRDECERLYQRIAELEAMPMQKESAV